MIRLAPEEILGLPVDELALHVLADFIESDVWNEYNYIISYKEGRYRRYHNRDDVYRALAEAIGWLRTNVMVARKPGESSSNAIFVTRWGHEAVKLTARDIRTIMRVQDNLHPLLLQRIRRQFLLGEYELAVFAAMREVEIRVRRLAGFGDDKIGVDLMAQAFKPGGPLADPSAPGGEVEGTMALFRGSYAVLRNPSGHREVSFDDVTEASEAVMTASLLMRILDRIEKRLNP